jgi:hypothetical protein
MPIWNNGEATWWTSRSRVCMCVRYVHYACADAHDTRDVRSKITQHALRAVISNYAVASFWKEIQNLARSNKHKFMFGLFWHLDLATVAFLIKFFIAWTIGNNVNPSNWIEDAEVIRCSIFLPAKHFPIVGNWWVLCESSDGLLSPCYCLRFGHSRFCIPPFTSAHLPGTYRMGNIDIWKQLKDGPGL